MALFYLLAQPLIFRTKSPKRFYPINSPLPTSYPVLLRENMGRGEERGICEDYNFSKLENLDVFHVKNIQVFLLN